MKQLMIPELETPAPAKARPAWPLVKLGDVCKIVSGSTPKREIPEYWGGDIPWVTPKDLSDLPTMYLHSVPEYITEAGYRSCSTTMLPRNSVLFSSRAPIGHVAINTIPVCTNQGFKSFIPEKHLKPEWLAYWLKSHKEYLQSLGNGATFKEISKSTIEEVEIPLPPLAEQQRIVARLDLAQRLIDQRKAQLALMDQLVQSLFYEMFGDPVKNEMGWELKPLKQLTLKIGSGATPKGGDASYKSEGIPLIRSLNVRLGAFQYKDLAFIDVVQAKKLDNVTVQLEDVLLNITGASVARVCVVPDDVVPARVNQHVSILRCNKQLKSCFLSFCLLSDSMQSHLWRIAEAGATRQAITKQQIEDLLIPLPPLPLQQTFADRVQQIEALKQQMQVSLAELDQGFQALMQEAFGH